MNRMIVDKSQSEVSVGALFKCVFLLVWALCFFSAIGVIYSTFESRTHTQVLEEMRRDEIGLRVSAGQFELEKSALASYPRVETIALEELGMSPPLSGATVLVVRE